MKVLLCASRAAPLFEAQQLAAACRDLGFDVVTFDHSSSRDPTLELPAAVRDARPDVVLIASPGREDPATLGLVRGFGARVCLWIPPAVRSAPAHLSTRRRWLARAADGVAVTCASDAALFTDRRGRSAEVVPGGYHARTLGITETNPPPARLGAHVAVRGSGDALRVTAPTEDVRVIGYGNPELFPRFATVRSLHEPAGFCGAVSGYKFLDGGRDGVAAPSVFDAPMAATAAGSQVLTVPFLGSIGAATPIMQGVQDAGKIAEAAFTERLSHLPAFLDAG